jgi:hypothetical protein
VYQIHLSVGKIQHSIELDHSDIRSLKGTCIYGVNINGYATNSNFLKIPSSFNKNTLDYISTLELSTVIQLMSKAERMMGDNLIRFHYKGVTYITDGTRYRESDSSLNDKVKFTDKKSSFMFGEKATLVHESLIPFLICLITPEIEEDKPELLMMSNKDNMSKYLKLEFKELLQDLMLFVSWMNSQDVNTEKKFALSIILIYTIVSNLRIQHNDLIEMCFALTNGSVGLNDVMLICKNPQIPHDGTYNGSCTYYCGANLQISN